MNRPNFWEFDSPGKYLYEQYKYIRNVRKVNIKDFLVLLNFSNRSSLYNIFRDHVHINADNIELYKTVFKLNEEEGEYLILLTVRDMSATQYEKKMWQQKIDELLEKQVTANTFNKNDGALFNMWDDFVKVKDSLDLDKKKDKIAS